MKTRHLLIACLMTLSPACGSNDSNKGPSDSDGATETNVVPAPCSGNEDCPEGIECVYEDEADDVGHCDVAETNDDTSSSAPAPCASNDECPEGIECVQLDEGSQGFCDVDETVESPDDSGTSLGAPAPCSSNDECPEGIECIQFEEGALGYCNVDETIDG